MFIILYAWTRAVLRNGWYNILRQTESKATDYIVGRRRCNRINRCLYCQLVWCSWTKVHRKKLKKCVIIMGGLAHVPDHILLELAWAEIWCDDCWVLINSMCASSFSANMEPFVIVLLVRDNAPFALGVLYSCISLPVGMLLLAASIVTGIVDKVSSDRVNRI